VGGLGPAYPGLTPRGYYQSPQVGLHKGHGFPFLTLCGSAAPREAVFPAVPLYPSASICVICG
jgi:hypothetical protein